MATTFAVGDRVRIHDRATPLHHRTPHYVKGSVGTIVFRCGDEGRPESLGHDGDGTPTVTVYRVRVALSDLWPNAPMNTRDVLEVEVYDHWLDAVEA